MESNVGFFGQFKYAFKGIIKPRFFNRLTNPHGFGMAIYIAFMAIIAAAAFWGIMYLRCLGPEGFISQTKRSISNMPQFSYQSGEITFEEKTYITGIFNTYFVFDSNVEKPDDDSISNDEIFTDWSIGHNLVVFNKKEMYIRPLFKGIKFTYSNKSIADLLGLPSVFNREGFSGAMEKNFMLYFLIIAGISIIPFIIKAVITGFLFGLVGWGIVKIVKQPYTYKELVKVSFYITGITTVFKSALMASPVRPGYVIVSIIFLLIGAVYLFFAIVGSTEEVGPTSTVVFNKPSSGKFSDEIAPPDPFERKTTSAPFAARTAPKTTPAAPPVNLSTPAATSVNVLTAPAAQSVPSAPKITPSAPSINENPVSSAFSSVPEAKTSKAEEKVTDEPAKEAAPEKTMFHAVNTAPARQRPRSIFDEVEGRVPVSVPKEETPIEVPDEEVPVSEPEVEIKKEEPASAIIKSDLTTFGGVGQFSKGGKKNKPKYDRPITAPDAYNGLYYSGSDSEESYESNYGSGTLADRGGLYGKTIGGESQANPFASVLGTPTASASSTSAFGTSQSNGNFGGSLYSNPHTNDTSAEHVTFTTKEGSTPFGNGGFYLSNPPKKNSDPTSGKSITKNGKTINRYSDDDFAAWEREAYADEFNKPRGGFGNNIF